MDIFNHLSLSECQLRLCFLSLKQGWRAWKTNSLRGFGTLEIGDQIELWEPGTLFLEFNPGANNMIMVISGSHGVEGAIGSDIQEMILNSPDSGFLDHQLLIQNNIGIVLVHALNPWGWANCQRTDSDNVDIIRNGFDGEPPKTQEMNPEISALVNPVKCDEGWYKKLYEWLAPDKVGVLKKEVFRGQFTNPNGIFYGGNKPSRSKMVLRDYCKKNLSDCKSLTVIDIHSGLGGFGETTLISSSTNDSEIKKLRKWFGQKIHLINLGQNETVSAVDNTLMGMIQKWLPNTSVIQFADEIGTIPFEESFPIFVAYNRLSGDHISRTIKDSSVIDSLASKLHGRINKTCNGREVKDYFASIWYPSILDEENGEKWLDMATNGFRGIWKKVVDGMIGQ